MSGEEPRSRVVVFRLTEDEYKALKKASARARRSMSDFTRAEVLSAISAAPQHELLRGFGERLNEIKAGIEDLKELTLCMMPERHSGAGGR